MNSEIKNGNFKYSFLLGSALRSEDAESFLEVYDALIPKDIPREQVSCLAILSQTSVFQT